MQDDPKGYDVGRITDAAKKAAEKAEKEAKKAKKAAKKSNRAFTGVSGRFPGGRLRD